MNIVRIREKAKEMHRTDNFIDAELLHLLLHAPLFVYPDRKEPLNPQEVAWFQENIGGGENHQIPVKLPFDAFILATKIGGQSGTIYVVKKNKTYKTTDGLREVMLNIIGCFNEGRDEAWWRGGYTGTLKNGMICELFLNGKSKEIKTDKGLAAAKHNMNLIGQTVQQFAFDVMSSFSTVLKCSPKPTQGKSVEWHLSRTHYCIVARKQAEEFRASKRGPSNGEIIRAAGWRRAHFRTLSSLRFTHKRGMQVPVRQAWVGPSEWEGLDGKIYKVML